MTDLQRSWILVVLASTISFVILDISLKFGYFLLGCANLSSFLRFNRSGSKSYCWYFGSETRKRVNCS